MLEPRISPTLPDWIKDHLTRYLATDGEDGYLWDSAFGGGEGMVTTLLLSTVGRRSGVTLTLPLIFGETATGYAIIASKGGAPAHPAWFLNLEAQPEVTVQIKGETFTATARVVEGAERETIWKMMQGIYAPYDSYQAATERLIPVVVLER
ncbi:MAG: deazaflavin-dependent oxidoreductase (nitroreductase family) [Halieaceae bacterium]|jgi:deazaflavin-dependent oxidoreductase (nitroreductase family)